MPVPCPTSLRWWSVADTTAQLRRHGAGFENGFHRGGVDRVAGESSVEVHQMQPSAASFDKSFGLCGRIVIEDGRAGHIAVHKANGLTVFEVDGGKEDHSEVPVITCLWLLA